jgi:hypothetical protein
MGRIKIWSKGDLYDMEMPSGKQSGIAVDAVAKAIRADSDARISFMDAGPTRARTAGAVRRELERLGGPAIEPDDCERCGNTGTLSDGTPCRGCVD